MIIFAKQNVLCVFFFANMYPRSCYLSSTTECNDIVLYVPATQMTLSLIGVWAFFWKVEPPPKQRTLAAGYTYCISPSTPGGLLILLHIFMFLFVSRRILGIVNGYISDTKGMGMGWDLDICRWGGGCFEKQNADAKHKYQCSCAYIFPIWENSLTTSVWEHIDIYIYIHIHIICITSVCTNTHILHEKNIVQTTTPRNRSTLNLKITQIGLRKNHLRTKPPCL